MNSARTGLVVLGVVLLLAGGTFALQGANYIGGSSMTGSSFWLYAGIGIAVLGLLLLLGSLTMKSRNQNVPPAGQAQAA